MRYVLLDVRHHSLRMLFPRRLYCIWQNLKHISHRNVLCVNRNPDVGSEAVKIWRKKIVNTEMKFLTVFERHNSTRRCHGQYSGVTTWREQATLPRYVPENLHRLTIFLSKKIYFLSYVLLISSCFCLLLIPIKLYNVITS